MNIVLDKGAYLPERAHDADAGFDLRTPYDIVLPPCTAMHGVGRCFLDTGVHMEIPKGYAGLLVSKSGLNVKHHITGTGLIDSGYRGSICVKLYNHGTEEYRFERGDKVIQIIIIPVLTPELVEVDALTYTDRGNGGFGSTGR